MLRRLAERTPTPGGGTAAAITCAIAASLVEMAAGFAGAAPDLVAPVAGLRARALALADADVHAYGAVLEALRLPEDGGRPQAVAVALSAACDVPLEIAQVGAEIGRLAGIAAERSRRGVAGDAAAGAVLAEAGCRAAALLVELNLRGLPDDRRHDVAEFVKEASISGCHAVAQASDI